MRSDFCVFILTYGRPDNVRTARALRLSGYSGRTFLVVDDADPALERYREAYGDKVLVFSKEEIARDFDQGDNFTDRRAVFYARNACWRLAEEVGCRFFVQLDDDYQDFLYRIAGRRGEDKAPKYHGWRVKSIDRVFDAMITFVEATGCASLAMSQGGDHIGGAAGNTEIRLTRKAMNSFVCNTAHPFAFRGRVNEDVNTYVSLGNVGELFFTYWPLQLNQTQTQQAEGGMTGLYLDGGTYLKSFYTVLYAPSCVRVEYQASMRRLHHRVAWNDAVPKIVREGLRNASPA